MDRGRAICEELKRAGVNHIAWLPCSESHFMHDAILSDPEITATQVCREAEAVAICGGLYLGGKRGAVLSEDQGIFDSGNILKWAVTVRAPMVLLIGHLFGGLAKPASQSNEPGAVQDRIVPFLDAFGINHYCVYSDEDVSRIGPACEEAWSTGKPVGLLLTSADGFMPLSIYRAGQ